MRHLMLLRHAKTEADAPSGRDFDRRLDERGRADAALMASWMTEQNIKPDRALVSTAVRARQTWDIIEASLAEARIYPRAAHLAQLYEAEPSQLLEALHAGGDDADTVLIIAHNPGLHEFAFSLVGKGDEAARARLASDLPTSALVSIDFEIGDWRNAAFRGGNLTQFVTPKLLQSR